MQTNRTLVAGLTGFLTFIAGSILAPAEAASVRWTWIDPGNDARIEDYVGAPGGSVCVQAVDAATRQPATVRLWRDADPGGKKDLDVMTGSRTLKTKGLRYSVFVHNISGKPIYAAPCAASVSTIPIYKGTF